MPALSRHGVLVVLVISLLVALEVWALNSRLIGALTFDWAGGKSAREFALLLDLYVVIPAAILATSFILLRRRNDLRQRCLAAGRGVSAIVRRFGWLALVPLALWLRGTELGTAALVILIAIEVLLALVLVSRLSAIARHAGVARRAGHSTSTALQAAAIRSFGGGKQSFIVRVAIAELTLLYSGALGWAFAHRTRGIEFTNRRRSDDTFWIAAAVMIVLEAIPVHVLVHNYSPVAAWILTILSAYSLLWVVGDLFARRNRPHLLHDGLLRLNHGLRQEVVVSLDQIEVVKEADAQAVAQTGAVLGENANLVIELAEEVAVYGWFGTMSKARVIVLSVDEPDRFLQAIGKEPRKTHS